MLIKSGLNRVNLLKAIAFMAFCHAIVAGAAPSVAEKQNIEAYSQTSTLGAPKNLVSIDGFPLMLGGVGLGFDRLLTSSMSLGFFANSYTLKMSSEADYTMNLRAMGVRSRFFMTGTSGASGLYLGGALVNVSLDTRTRLNPGYQEGTASDRKTGFLGSIGYQIMGRELNSGRMLVNLALLAGTGLSGTSQARGNTFSKQTEASTSIGSGIGAEATLGYLF